MSVRVCSGAVLGIDAYQVDVEVDLSTGMPAFDLVGLAEGAVRESRVRVRAALKNAGFQHPLYSRRVTVNLAPANIRKDGTAYDVPIALGLLAALGVIPPQVLQDVVFVGELALNGEIKAIRGALAIAAMAQEEGHKMVIVPLENAPEAAVVEGIDVYGIASLGGLVAFLLGEEQLQPIEAVAGIDDALDGQGGLEDVKGQEHVKRALEVAASGNHNVLMVGPPGSGKTMLARRMATILPPLDFASALEATKVYSICGLLRGEGLLAARPFRTPHHTISDAGLVGGGAIPRPGEISLAHQGVLFLDELPEFRRNVLEVLRQPLEERAVTISRAAITLRYPADFLLVAAMNPCPCGGTPCRCSAVEVQRYRGKLSGPLLDRIDLHIEVPPVSFQDLSDERSGERSSVIRDRVSAARQRQKERFAGEPIDVNASMGPRHIREFCQVDDRGMQLLERAVNHLGMSARAYNRILKVARTIADLEDSDKIEGYHIAESVHYRSLDRRYR